MKYFGKKLIINPQKLCLLFYEWVNIKQKIIFSTEIHFKWMWMCVLYILFTNRLSSLHQLEPNAVCTKIDYFYSIANFICMQEQHEKPPKIYILYEVNPVEGFNLRRDVYIRLAVFTKYLRTQSGYERTTLVLPPFQRLYHWKSADIEQSLIYWNHFFNLNDLKKFTNVIDIWEYFNEIRRQHLHHHHHHHHIDNIQINHLIKLTNFPDMFESGKFVEKFEISKIKNRHKTNSVYGYQNITIERENIVNYQGSAMMLHKLLLQIRSNHTETIQNYYSIVIRNAEIVLHDHWGNEEFWLARRSMRFSKHLVETANNYRKLRFGSDDASDLVQRPANWLDERPYRGARGGNYLCAHIRRADFVYGREQTTPSLRSVATQIKLKLNELQLDKVFVSSDCSRPEYKDLKSYLRRAKLYRFTADTFVERNALKDGGIAIVDQIICSHARYFMGSQESTFTYRIYEEREILGFPKDATFNTLCKNEDGSDCEKNSVWPIVY